MFVELVEEIDEKQLDPQYFGEADVNPETAKHSGCSVAAVVDSIAGAAVDSVGSSDSVDAELARN